MSESCWETGFQERLWGTFQSLLSMTGVVLWPFHPDVAHAELVTLSGFLCWKEGVLLGCSSYWNTERGSLLQGPPAWRVGNIHHWKMLQMLLNAASAWVGWLCCCNGTISFGLKMHIPGSNITLCPPRKNLVCSLVLWPHPTVSSSTFHRSCWGKKTEICLFFQFRQVCCVTLTGE